MINPKPNWWPLYGTLLLAMVLLATVAFTDPSARWRQLAECLIVVTIFGAITLWVRANRVALALIDRAPGAVEPLRAWWAAFFTDYPVLIQEYRKAVGTTVAKVMGAAAPAGAGGRVGPGGRRALD